MSPAKPTGTPNTWEHALPYRVLIQELQARGKDVPADVEDLLQTWEKRQEALAEAKKRDLQGTPEEDDAILREYRTAVAECAEAEKPLKKILHKADLSALCFSGGGIRSASFGLGVLTQLARLSSSDTDNGVLNKIDYVSTVSGGGYVGSWFTGWIKRHPTQLKGVIQDLAGPPPTSTDPEPAPVRHLRDYTSYLAPRSGLLSPDMWTLVAIFLRNLLLNWAILVPAFAALLLLLLLDTFAFSAVNQRFEVTWLLVSAVVLAGTALGYTALKLPGNFKIQPKETNFAWVGIPLLLSAWSLAACFLKAHSEGVDFHSKFWLLLGMAGAAHAVLAVRYFVVRWRKRKERPLYLGRDLAGQFFACAASAFFAAWLLWLLAYTLGDRLLFDGDVRFFTSMSVPIILAVFALTAVLLNGLGGVFDAEEDREWWSRSGAYMLMVIIAWPLVHLLVLYTREITEAASFTFLGGRGSVNIPALAGIIGALASWAGFSPATASAHAKLDFDKLSGKGKLLAKSGMLIPVLGVLFFVLLAVSLARANELLICWIGKNTHLSPICAIYTVFGCALGLALILNVFVNVNTFSLHAMYRGRLVRSYLGASNNKRQPNPFTNFDTNDNFPLVEAPAGPNAPLHIVNIALNVVASKKLAWQQRKAESFTASALHCGSYRVGYRPTAEYAGSRGLTLGTAMGISGAAASPNMGYHSNPILSLVMTFFNARLGWWLPNPGHHGDGYWRKTSPLLSLVPLVNEAMGRTNDENKWVYLSDGGHFENLGLYEMVLRRCKRIIVVDGSADSSFTLEDLGNAVRKINIDLGVPIEFAPPVVYEALPKPSPRHWFLGHVRYSQIDKTPETEDGQLLYIKASLTGDEPADVTPYSKAHPDFPHESTANQFFNESQFESYVQLGSHIVDTIVGSNPPSPLSLEGLFTAAGGSGGAGAAAKSPS